MIPCLHRQAAFASQIDLWSCTWKWQLNKCWDGWFDACSTYSHFKTYVDVHFPTPLPLLYQVLAMEHEHRPGENGLRLYRYISSSSPVAFNPCPHHFSPLSRLMRHVLLVCCHLSPIITFLISPVCTDKSLLKYLAAARCLHRWSRGTWIAVSGNGGGGIGDGNRPEEVYGTLETRHCATLH